MTRWWDDLDDEDRDLPQPVDLDYDQDSETIDCPFCGEPIHEDTPRCPHCGMWVEDLSPAWQRSLGWFWPVMVALLVAVILVYWLGLGR